MKNLVAAIIVNILLVISAVFTVFAAVSTENPQVLIGVSWLLPSFFWLIYATARYMDIRGEKSEKAATEAQISAN